MSQTPQVNSSQSGETLINISTVMQRTGFEMTFIYNEMLMGRFPRKVKIGARSTRWVSSEVDEWIAGRIAGRDASNAAAPSQHQEAI